MAPSLRKRGNPKQIKRHAPYRKLIIPAVQFWNPKNKASQATSILRIINWIQRFGNCGSGPHSKFGRKCIRRAIFQNVRSGLLKRRKGSFLLVKKNQILK
ncbi:unnamed protein product [Adineta ricciae]|uniref:Uncharacterized protein n=1 Tax=Adineta ricciae TaxID=249248 RepID=A0A815NRG0_ADIRI|nr:unnamed protein product [Adineta ricciae]